MSSSLTIDSLLVMETTTSSSAASNAHKSREEKFIDDLFVLESAIEKRSMDIKFFTPSAPILGLTDGSLLLHQASNLFGGNDSRGGMSLMGSGSNSLEDEDEDGDDLRGNVFDIDDDDGDDDEDDNGHDSDATDNLGETLLNDSTESQ